MSTLETNAAKTECRRMPVFTFETNAPPHAVPTWVVECGTAEEAKVQAVEMPGDLVPSEAGKLLGGGAISMTVLSR